MPGDFRTISAGPLPVLAIVLLICLVLLLIPLLFLGFIGAAFTRLGLSWIAALALVLLMFAGSYVNIPLVRVKRDIVRAVPQHNAGSCLIFPSAAPIWETVISVNLGGALIPAAIAVYLLNRAAGAPGSSLIPALAACTLTVTIVSFLSAKEIPFAGIRVPYLLPGLTALLTGLLISGGTGLTAAVTAFAGGVFGTLAGGNLAHLPRVGDLEVPEVSIGGAGTFGTLFLCCILPALIA